MGAPLLRGLRGASQSSSGWTGTGTGRGHDTAAENHSRGGVDADGGTLGIEEESGVGVGLPRDSEEDRPWIRSGPRSPVGTVGTIGTVGTLGTMSSTLVGSAPDLLGGTAMTRKDTATAWMDAGTARMDGGRGSNASSAHMPVPIPISISTATSTSTLTDFGEYRVRSAGVDDDSLAPAQTGDGHGLNVNTPSTPPAHKDYGSNPDVTLNPSTTSTTIHPSATNPTDTTNATIQPSATNTTLALPPHPLTAFNLSQRTGSHYWAWLEARGNERRLERFGKAMDGSRGWEGEDDGMGCECFCFQI